MEKALRAIERIKNGTTIALASLQEDVSPSVIRRYLKEAGIKVDRNRNKFMPPRFKAKKCKG